MYGEKVEEVEELRLDLDDVKEMYKLQVSVAFLNNIVKFEIFLSIKLNKLSSLIQ